MKLNLSQEQWTLIGIKSGWIKTARDEEEGGMRWTGEEFEEVSPEPSFGIQDEDMAERIRRDHEEEKERVREQVMAEMTKLFDEWDAEKKARLDRLRRENPDLFRPVEESTRSK